jgi:hypothetical protein
MIRVLIKTHYIEVALNIKTNLLIPLKKKRKIYLNNFFVF